MAAQAYDPAHMKKQLLTALSVAVFVIGAGSFAYLANDIWSQGHPREIVDITPDKPLPPSNVQVSSAMTASSKAFPVPTDDAITVVLNNWGTPMPTKPETNFALVTDQLPYNSKGPATLTGTTSSETAKVVVTYTPTFGDSRDADVYTLGKYVPGNTQWTYAYSEKLGNMGEGMNEYVIKSYDASNQLIDDFTFVTIKDPWSGANRGPDEKAPIDVQWSDPVRANMLDILAKSGDRDRYLHAYKLDRVLAEVLSCTMGFEGEFRDEAPTTKLAEQQLRDERVYAVGTVASGEYAHSKVYTHQEQVYSCRGRQDETLLYHFIQTPDGRLFRADTADRRSVITKHMEWTGDTYVDAAGPREVTIDNSGVRLLSCAEAFCMTGSPVAESTVTPVTSGFTRAGTPVYDGVEGCYQVKRNDGFLGDYKVDIKMGGITWLDGTTSNTVYTGDPVTGGCGQQPHHCHWEYDGDPAELERVGTTVDGLEVYQEKISPAELVAMSSGSTNMKFGPTSLYELYWSMARYDESKIPTPKQFVAAHPAVYVKDPLARLLYFQGEQYGPAVECGKPVIYLYPEREQDIDVYVAPTGGFTVTDPPYNDGWHVRATPQSDIYNYGNGKNYPYLFWEGHGADYTRPTRGFVASRAEAPALVREKLALLGLVDNEIDDFMEFWEPRITAKPYVFVTFVDQPTFDTIAPLTVEPTPDTIIRVFMDYEPLDAPIKVDPLPIVTPVREGFSVVEWGGALHPGDRGMCPAGVLLQ